MHARHAGATEAQEPALPYRTLRSTRSTPTSTRCASTTSSRRSKRRDGSRSSAWHIARRKGTKGKPGFYTEFDTVLHRSVLSGGRSAIFGSAERVWATRRRHVGEDPQTNRPGAIRARDGSCQIRRLCWSRHQIASQDMAKLKFMSRAIGALLPCGAQAEDGVSDPHFDNLLNASGVDSVNNNPLT
jgi:hypothetical protein